VTEGAVVMEGVEVVMEGAEVVVVEEGEEVEKGALSWRSAWRIDRYTRLIRRWMRECKQKPTLIWVLVD
jgi:hypothetical protein